MGFTQLQMEEVVNTRVHKLLTSHEVFSCFILRDKTGVLIRENIMSPECLQLWVSSRKKLPKHPRDSFRRTLLAQIRGVDGRKGFPEDVERSLLGKLRVRNEKNLSAAIFDLDDAASAIVRKPLGNRLKPPYGFHEKRIAEQRDFSLCKFQERKSIYFYLARLVQVPEDLVKTMAESMERDTCVSAVVYLLSTIEDHESLNPEYCNPKPQERCFKPDLPIYEITHDLQDFTFSWVSDPPIDNSKKSGHISDLFLSMVEFWNTMKNIHNQLSLHDSSWVRFNMLTNTGLIAAALAHGVKSTEAVDHIWIQIDESYYINKAPKLLLY